MKKRPPEILILVGNIGTGKSTFARKCVKKGYVIIARDSLRYAIGAGKYIFDTTLEPAIFQTELEMLYNFLQLGVNIVVDEVGLTIPLRERYLKMIRGVFPHYKIIAVEFPKYSMKVAVSRRMKDPHGQPNRKLWEEIWSRFNEGYQIPTKEEGFDKIIKIKK